MSDRSAPDDDRRDGKRLEDDRTAGARPRPGRRGFLRRATAAPGLGLAGVACLYGLAGCSGPTDGRVYLSVAVGAFHATDERYLRGGLPDGDSRHAAALLTSEGVTLTEGAPDRLRDRVAAVAYGRQCLLVAESRTPRSTPRRLGVPTGGARIDDRTLSAELRDGTPTAAQTTGDDSSNGSEGLLYTGVYVLNLEGAPRPERAAVTFPDDDALTVTARGG